MWGESVLEEESGVGRDEQGDEKHGSWECLGTIQSFKQTEVI